MNNDICPLLSVASAAAGGTFAECRREGCAWWDAAGLCCCLHIVADAVQQAADELVRASADKREASQ